MKILATASVALLSTVLLGACGGDSDSSGTKKINPTSSTNPTTPPNTTKDDSCVPVDGLVKVPKSGGCTYSAPSLNDGAKLTYTCEVTTVTNGMLTAGNAINLNGIKLTCNY